ncbi:MAG: cation efflux family-domain-containing protein [Monoraphidium minutum]|nr:MAG: cation efflux family-domain-containing protein [Monoraphidium minutum]
MAAHQPLLKEPLLQQKDGSSSEDPVRASKSDCRLHDKCFLSEGQAKSRQQYKSVQRKLVTACILCFIFMVVEIIGGWIAHSIAIMSDAAHMLSDVSAFLVSIFAAWAATQPGTQLYSFGYHRAEILGALVSVLIIWLVTGALVVEAVQRTINPVRVDGKLMFIISVAGIVFNLLVMLSLGVHGHLGHTHDHGSGADHDHGHSHSHDHAEGEEHDHGHDHGHDHAHDPEDKEHGHCHGAKHSHSHSHGDGHSHGGASSSGGEEGGAGCGGGGSGAVVISVPVAACPGDAHAHGAERKRSAPQAGGREIEVRCELPRPAAAPGKRGGGGGGCGHAHGDNINLRGAVLHVIGDLVQSVGVAAAGLLIWMHQDDPRWYIADPICTFLFSVLVLWTTKNIMMDIFAVLMERAPQTVNPVQVMAAMSRVEGILDVHDLHVWNISTGIPVLTAHVHIGDEADQNQVLQALEVYVRDIGIKHSTIQICNPSTAPDASGSGGSSGGGGRGGGSDAGSSGSGHSHGGHEHSHDGHDHGHTHGAGGGCGHKH